MAGNEEIGEEPLAVSLISGLFVRGEGGSPLERALANDIEDAAALYRRFRRILIRWASQELFRRWRECDPDSARLWRNLKRAIQRDEKILSFPADRPKWLLLMDRVASNADIVIASPREIEMSLNRRGQAASCLTDIPYSVLVDVQSRHESPVAVEIEALFTALRCAFSELSKRYLESRVCDPPVDIDLDRAVERSKNAACMLVTQKLGKYEIDGKLSETEAAHFRAALLDFLSDLADGGPALTHHEYLSRHYRSLDRKTYRLRYRTRFEYLAELTQTAFRLTLQENYED